jgi:DNA topoisomerase-3
VDFTGQEVLGPCPKCQSNVYEQPMSYLCEKSVGPTKSCDFRSGKVILQQEISKADMQKLLSEGRTTLLRGFVSNRTKRKFSAFLVRGKDGKVGFEFEERKAAAPKKPAKVSPGEMASPSGTASEVVSAPEVKAAKAPAKKATKPASKTAAKTPAKTPAKKAVVKTKAK